MTRRAIVCFGKGQDGASRLLEGWFEPEDGFTWSRGSHSALLLAVPDRCGEDLLVEFTVRAHWAPEKPTRRLGITVDGAQLAFEVVQRETVLGVQIPAERFADRPSLRVSFQHPDAASPHELGLGDDTRRISIALVQAAVTWVAAPLPFSPVYRPPAPLRGDGGAADMEVVRGLTGLPASDLVRFFESLGLWCEFGLIQREFEVETLGLLRFMGLPYPQLIRALYEVFSAFDQLETVRPVVLGDEREVYFRVDAYDMVYQAFLRSDDPRLDRLMLQQPRQLRFRRDKLLGLMETGEKLFVILRQEGFSLAQALPLAAALRARGAGALVFMTTGGRLPPGSVYAHGPRLFEGALSVERFEHGKDGPAGRTWLARRAVTEWLSVTANAYRLWRALGGLTAASPE